MNRLIFNNTRLLPLHFVAASKEVNMELQVNAEMLLRVAVAMGLAGIMGAERELAGKPAGLRTHMFVAGAATVVMLLGDLVVSQYLTDEGRGSVQTDPIRLFEAVVAGVSFLGAGVIFRSQKDEVEGLTTAASLLFVATIGIAVGVSSYIFAAGLALLGLFVSRGILWLERILMAWRA
jgi:putative Mg2+ transporter-C (MgtC) family protein